MTKKIRSFVTIVFVLLLFATTFTHASMVLHVSLEVDKLSIVVNEEAVISVKGWVEDGTAGNGLIQWEASLIRIDSAPGNAVEILGGDFTSIVYNPFFTSVNHSTVDSPRGGDVQAAGAANWDATLSEVGVDQYTLLAEITVVGKAPGTVEYELNGDYLASFVGVLADGITELPINPESTVQLEVTPEPLTFTLLGCGMVVLMRRRHRHS